MALVKESHPELGKEIQALLCRRLWILAVITSAAFLAHALGIVAPRFTGDQESSIEAWLVLGFVLIVPAAGGVVAATLWRHPGAGLPTLRNLEVIFFGSVATSHLWSAVEVFTMGWLHKFAREGQTAVLWIADYTVLRWFSLIVVYGLLIPNTWHRCAVITGAMAALPVGISLVLGLADSALEASWLRHYVLEVAIWLVAGALLATYGSHKISLLRQEAFTARKFGQYQLKQRLGSGGMGEVYLAEHLLLKQPCAIKLIRPEKAGDPTALRRFRREVEAMSRLTHWNTVKILDYGLTHDGTFYYAMEYLPGLSLEDLVRRHGPIPAARAVHMLRQICGALREAHGMGLIHRDIKPSNILACERGGSHDVAKLLDFGLVQNLGPSEPEEKLTQEGTIAGTPAYMSPEQASGSDHLDARTDIYSLGAVAYYLLTGQPPFRRDKPVQVLLAHLRDPVPPLQSHRPDVPSDLEQVCLGCLEKEPARRFPDIASLEAALAECACAGQWTEQLAAAWWRTHGAEGSAGPTPGTTVTAATSPWERPAELPSGATRDS
ncbi:MAG: serine/threonine protein kinase [Gemmataceae bacterium]|nr:serine/threonine protein kinase [Gemmataceae bacterium]